MKTQEIIKQDAWRFLDCQVKAQKLMRKRFESLKGVKVLSLTDDIQISNLMYWCELLDIPYIREDWDGNKDCRSNWDTVYFDYKGIRFFELVDKE